MKPNSITWADVGGVDIFFGLFALFAFVIGIKSLIEYRRLALTNGMISGTDLLGTFGALPLAFALGYSAYYGINAHRLLRGECRYTMARVYRNWRYKGDKESRFEYWVAGKRYRMDERMSWRGGWRPLGSWWYVRFAVPDPSVYEYLDKPVPDSVRYAPGRGWASLPAPPAPPPVSPPARFVPAPPTGPPASPVFRAAHGDSAARVPATPTLALPQLRTGARLDTLQ